MPQDFFSAIVKMRVGEISQPIRTRLGFHIVELTDFKPARQMNFEEVRSEIQLAIKNEKCRAALQSLTADLLRRAKIVRLLQASTWNSQTSALPPGVFARSLTFTEVSTTPPRAFDLVCSAQIEKLLE